MDAVGISKNVGSSTSEPPIVGSIPKKDWRAIIVFSLVSIISLVGVPIYVVKNGLPLPVMCLMFFWLMATGFSITAGYHRLFSHRCFKAKALARFFFLFFGAGAGEGTAIHWSSQHRDHHSFTDTDRDPYNSKRGFWYSHLKWMTLWQHVVCYDNVKDLTKQRMIMHQHNHYMWWSLVAGVLLPIFLGYLLGYAWGALIFAVGLRMVIVYNSTFFINSVCHMFGKLTYDKHSSARDNWFIAFLTYGEGYHNFHHKFPRDYRNGIRFYDWDPSKWLIYFLFLIGQASDLKTIENKRIQEAKQI